MQVYDIDSGKKAIVLFLSLSDVNVIVQFTEKKQVNKVENEKADSVHMCQSGNKFPYFNI